MDTDQNKIHQLEKELKEARRCLADRDQLIGDLAALMRILITAFGFLQEAEELERKEKESGTN